MGSYNLFAYCLNNPINNTDDSGTFSLPNWAKVAIGVATTVAAVAVTVATGGAALPIIAGVAASTAVSGAIGYATDGIEGMKDGLANGLMWGGIGALGASVAKIGVQALQQAGKLPIKVNINSVVNNPADEFVTIGPKSGRVGEYIRQISQTGDYGKIYVTKLAKGLYQIADGHHRVEALRKLGYETIKVFITK